MTYEDALLYIHSKLKFGIKPGLERISRLLALLDNPQNHLKFIHVAGTNGKGSTTVMIASILKKSGYKTGMYISPYITDFCERMQVDGRPISHQELADVIQKIAPVVEQLSTEGEILTEFEIVTAAAFLWLHQMNCVLVVLEVGLGGRFDATNVIDTPLASVITSISLDHIDILGDTLAKIAFEKCGIIKSNGITICYPNQHNEALEVIRNRAETENNMLIIPNISNVKVKKISIDGTDILYKGLDIHIPLLGEYQIANTITAIEVVIALREHKELNISDEAIISGINKVIFSARMEKLSIKPLILLDGAHNPDGTAALAKCICQLLNGRKIVAIMGMLADKNYTQSIANIAPLCETFIAVRPDNPRALNPTETARVASAYCNNIMAYESYQEAIIKAMQIVDEDGTIIICGSLYLCGAIRKTYLDNFQK
jgi:dihydrofolate synthase/folylpolyglutamate synthase